MAIYNSIENDDHFKVRVEDDLRHIKTRETVILLSPSVMALLLAACGGGGGGGSKIETSNAPTSFEESDGKDQNNEAEPTNQNTSLNETSLAFNSENEDVPVIVPDAQSFNRGQAVYAPQVTGQTSSSNLRYSKTGADENSFEINTNTGELRFAEGVNLNPNSSEFKDNYYVTIIVIDNKGTPDTSDDEVAHQEVTISIDASSGAAPLVMSLSSNERHLAEGQFPNGMKLSTISFAGGSIGASTSVKLFGTDLDLFEIRNGNELWLKEDIMLDFEQRSDRALSITLISEHDETVQEQFTLHLQNIDELHSLDVPIGQYVIEDNTRDFILGSLEANDPEGDQITFDVVGATSSNNIFDGKYGQLQLNPITGAYRYSVDNSAALVNEFNIHETLTDSFMVRATDSKQQSTSKTLHFDILGVNDAPTDILLSDNTFREAEESLVIGVLTTIDPDQPENEKFIYSLDLPKNEYGYYSLFTINNETGELLFKSREDSAEIFADTSYYADGDIDTHIIVTDSGGKSFTKTFKILLIAQENSSNSEMLPVNAFDDSVALSQTAFEVM